MISKNSPHIKQRIKQQFSSSAQNYDSKAGFQKKIAEELLRYIVSQLTTHDSQTTTVLDIGCGTGFLTIPLADTFPNADIFACDIAHRMVKTARLNVRDPRLFLTADCESLPYKNSQFDIAASNLVYQWSGDLDTAFKEAHRILEKGGMFAFSMLGKKTFKELRECYKEANHISNKNGLPPFMNFLSRDNILLKLKRAGFSYAFTEISLRIESYQNLLGLLKTLKTIGAGNPFDGGRKDLGGGAALKKMAHIYEKRFNLQTDIYATYEVIFILTRK